MNGRHGRNDWDDRRGRAIFATPGGGWADRWLSPRRAFGSAAFACFCLSLALSLPRLSLPAAFALALGIAVGIQALTRLRLSPPRTH